MEKDNLCRVFWYDRNGVGRSITVGQVNEETTEWIIEQVDKVMDPNAGKTNWYVEFAKLQPYHSTNVSRYFIELSREERIGKVAFVVASGILKKIVNMVMKTSGCLHHSKVFSIEEEALKWLKHET